MRAPTLRPESTIVSFRKPWVDARVWAIVACASAWACKSEPPDARGPARASEQAAGSAAGPPGTIDVSCVGTEQVPAPTRATITALASETLNRLRTGDHDGIWASLHPRARNDEQRAGFMQALAAMQTRLTDATDPPTPGGVHYVEVKGGVSHLAQVQCDEGDDAFVMLLNAGNEDIAVVSFELAGEAFGYVATLELRARGADWRLVGIQVNPSSYRNKTAVDFERLADGYTAQQKLVPGYLALGVAQTLAARGSIKSQSKQRIDTKLEQLRGNQLLEAELGTWTVAGTPFAIEGLSLASTRVDISPVVKYVSPGGLVREILEREADALLGYVKQRYPELANDFDAIVFEAYANSPDKAGESYDAYRLARYFDGRERAG